MRFDTKFTKSHIVFIRSHMPWTEFHMIFTKCHVLFGHDFKWFQSDLRKLVEDFYVTWIGCHMTCSGYHMLFESMSYCFNMNFIWLESNVMRCQQDVMWFQMLGAKTQTAQNSSLKAKNFKTLSADFPQVREANVTASAFAAAPTATAADAAKK